jgi:excisionase family DNA binding protein
MTRRDYFAQLPSPVVQPTVTVEHAGRILGISRASAYDGVARGEIPSIRVGRRLLVPTAALRRLLAIDADPIDAA